MIFLSVLFSAYVPTKNKQQSLLLISGYHFVEIILKESGQTIEKQRTIISIDGILRSNDASKTSQRFNEIGIGLRRRRRKRRS